MGNTLGGKKFVKVMKINGEMIKLKTPVHVREVTKDYPGHVLLESEAVKHYGVRAKPLEPQQELNPKLLYFLVELPKFPEGKSARRVKSGIEMSAKDRLESLMLSRRSTSDLSIMKQPSIMSGSARTTRLKLRLSRAEVEKLMMESKDDAVVAEKIVSLYMSKNAKENNTETTQSTVVPGGDEAAEKFGSLCMTNGTGADTTNAGASVTFEPNKIQQDASLPPQALQWKPKTGVGRRGLKSREKRVGFLSTVEGEMQLAVAS